MKAKALMIKSKTALQSDAGLRRMCLSLGLLGFLGVGYLVFILTLPRPDTWVTLTTNSESISFTVTNPDMAAFRANGMRAVSIEGSLDDCIDAFVLPKKGARVEYRRGDDGYFRITIDPSRPGDPAASLRSLKKDNPIPPPSGSLILTASLACPGSPPVRLPIWGIASFGEEPRPVGPSGEIAPGIMIEAKLSVFARSHARLLGIGFPSVVYPVTSFELPAGSVLGFPGPIDDASGLPEWNGLAFLDKQKRGFQIEATTRSPQVRLRSPGERAVDGREQLDLAKYAQFLSDPNVIEI